MTGWILDRLHRGQIIHDFQGAEKRRLRPDDLLARFEEARRAEQLDESAAEMLRRYRFPVPWVTLSSFSGAIIAADLMAVTAGTRLGPCEILAPLGAGGMGEGYRARDTRLDRTVAIKSLPATFAGDADRLDRFEHEARLLGTVNHPNLLAIHDVGAPGRSPLSGLGVARRANSAGEDEHWPVIPTQGS